MRQIIKTYGHEETTDNRRYSAPEVRFLLKRKSYTGNPKRRPDLDQLRRAPERYDPPSHAPL